MFEGPLRTDHNAFWQELQAMSFKDSNYVKHTSKDLKVNYYNSQLEEAVLEKKVQELVRVELMRAQQEMKQSFDSNSKNLKHLIE